MKRILFVCTGNICRSPTADGVARKLAESAGLAGLFEFDSAGTHSYHTGEAPDRRAQAVARRRGYDLSRLRARPVCDEDFEYFDLILAMDKGHLVWLKRACPPSLQHKLDLFLNCVPELAGQDVLDPYYGDTSDFETVFTQCELALRALIARES